MYASSTRPGLRFVTAAAPRQDAFPRMDVGAFVGFAQMGPLHLPVPVESAVEFDRIFGGRVELPGPANVDYPVVAYLRPAVHAFFVNGGQRCWVVRVADESEAARAEISVPSRLEVRSGGDEAVPSRAVARCPGSWSDGLSVATTTRVEPGFRLWAVPDGDAMAVTGPSSVAVGDVLRVRIDNAWCFVPVVAVEQQTPTPVGAFVATELVKLDLSRAVSLPPLPEDQSWADAASVAWGHNWLCSESVIDHEILHDGEGWLDVATQHDGPRPGEVVRVSKDGVIFVMSVVACEKLDETPGTPVRRVFRVFGRGVRTQSLAASPAGRAPPGDGWPAQRVSLVVYAREASGRVVRMTDLALHERHPRCWTRIPTDSIRFALSQEPRTARRPRRAADELRDEAVQTGFPLGGAASDDASEAPRDRFFVPIGADLLPLRYVRADPSSDPDLKRDGLRRFRDVLFFSPELARVPTSRILRRKEALKQSAGFRLKGVHALLEIAEATLVAVPDAVHVGWAEPETNSGSITRTKSPEASPEPEPSFSRCSALLSPVVSAPALVEPGQPFLLTWAHPGAQQFEVQEAVRDDLRDARTVARVATLEWAVPVRPAGDYFYRVRALAADPKAEPGAWSNVLAVLVPDQLEWDPVDFDPKALVATHRALLRMCAARSDLFAVLALPLHFSPDLVRGYGARLVTSVPESSGSAGAAVLGPEERRLLGYGALYHPWTLSVSDGAVVARHPPDGAAMGLIAQRSRERGPWVAPANMAFAGVLATDGEVTPAAEATLQAGDVNLIRRCPHGFVTLGARTLQRDPDLGHIGVRRLLILLRLLALRHGERFVFEPNGPALRRLVRRTFRSVLERLFAAGALAGRTSAEAYRVLVDPRAEGAEDRLEVLIQVAPSKPLEFLTVRLAQRGGNALTVEEV